jgi:hypothetical protein
VQGYLDCKCGSKDTYISVAKDVCCSNCFIALEKELIERKDVEIDLIADDGGWAVKVNSKVDKYFSKYEDYALTEARNYLDKLKSASSNS